MHIGMIVGIGPAATDYYYRYLISAMAAEGLDLQLTMAHADTPTLLRHQAGGDQAAQVAIYLQLAERLKRCGIECIAVTSIAGHFCIEVFVRAGAALVNDHGCESVMLAGTDLALVFNKRSDPGFPFLDCAEVHAAAIAQFAMRP